MGRGHYGLLLSLDKQASFGISTWKQMLIQAKEIKDGSAMVGMARFRDVQWRRIWCIVGLKVDQNKTTVVRVTVKRIFQ